MSLNVSSALDRIDDLSPSLLAAPSIRLRMIEAISWHVIPFCRSFTRSRVLAAATKPMLAPGRGALLTPAWSMPAQAGEDASTTEAAVKMTSLSGGCVYSL